MVLALFGGGGQASERASTAVASAGLVHFLPSIPFPLCILHLTDRLDLYQPNNVRVGGRQQQREHEWDSAGEE
jgi:hypothetical protein